MNENWPYIKENIKRFPEYKSSIFEQGFLITNQNLTIGGAFPFFGNWRKESLSYLASLSAKAIRHGKEWNYLLFDWPRI